LKDSVVIELESVDLAEFVVVENDEFVEYG
jgi:hypothetical protein